MIAGRSLFALSAFRFPLLRYSASPRHIAVRVSPEKTKRLDLIHQRAMSEPSAAQKRVGDDDPEVSAEVEAPSLKRQKFTTDSVVPDIQMSDVASELAPESASEQVADGGAVEVEAEVEVQVGGVIADSPSSPSNTKKSDSSRPRRAARDRKARAEAEGTAVVRLPKRQSALLIGFCGSGYSGMQIQPDGVKTIEGVLFKALVDAGAVSQDNADDPVKVSLARAARTDAGVHAAGNVVSIKMIVTVPGVKDLVGRINELLPPEIRLWGFSRVQNSFNARLVCDSRKYTYYFPSYLLIPPKPDSGLHRVLLRKQQEVASPQSTSSTETPSSDPSSSPLHPFWGSAPPGSTPEDDLVRKREWRVGQADLERLREFVRKYEGSHNFHNFTVGREFGDRSNLRFMKEIRIEDPVVHGNTEWIAVMWHGQSFMLHQIRKMMAAIVLSCRTNTSPAIIDELYKSNTVFIPKMPSLGLLLEEPLFNSYNGRMAAGNERLQPTDADYRPPIDFEVHREKIDAFKEQFIYKNMRGIEDMSGLFDAWVRSVDSYAGKDLLWLNQSGKIPSECVIRKGERRNHPFKEKRIFDTTSFPSETGLIKKQLLKEESVEAEGEEGQSEEEEVLDKKQLAETEG
ncbi:tRNA pseudouridine synthase [Coprinellus micaceus]|uniref:tRNA pseudouridine synthase 1 n=1 Tax=Coprinellus micaceus TaxID=71717 RepID=A0A4Y7TR77_COPMI|nr:tRNA pseudouridine synthase [Coprinellus micaceus]